MRTRPLVIGHRGNAGPAPANTLAGFEEAVQIGVDMIEVDLRVTCDGEIVLMHNETVDETTDGTGWVDQMTLAEIRRLDAGSWKSPRYRGERVPTLREALEFARGRVHLSLDLKDARAIPGMVRLIHETDMMDQVVVCGCDTRRAAQVRQQEPHLTVVLNMDETMQRLAKTNSKTFIRRYLAQATEAHLAALNMSHKYITPELIYAARLRALPVWAWTVDDPEDIRRLVAMGVDAIYSNWPERVLQVLDGSNA